MGITTAGADAEARFCRVTGAVGCNKADGDARLGDITVEI
jgi:hypothetical protein